MILSHRRRRARKANDYASSFALLCALPDPMVTIYVLFVPCSQVRFPFSNSIPSINTLMSTPAFYIESVPPNYLAARVNEMLNIEYPSAEHLPLLKQAYVNSVVDFSTSECKRRTAEVERDAARNELRQARCDVAAAQRQVDEALRKHKAYDELLNAAHRDTDKVKEELEQVRRELFNREQFHEDTHRKLTRLANENIFLEQVQHKLREVVGQRDAARAAVADADRDREMAEATLRHTREILSAEIAALEAKVEQLKSALACAMDGNGVLCYKCYKNPKENDDDQ